MRGVEEKTPVWEFPIGLKRASLWSSCGRLWSETTENACASEFRNKTRPCLRPPCHRFPLDQTGHPSRERARRREQEPPPLRAAALLPEDDLRETGNFGSGSVFGLVFFGVGALLRGGMGGVGVGVPNKRQPKMPPSSITPIPGQNDDMIYIYICMICCIPLGYTKQIILR